MWLSCPVGVHTIERNASMFNKSGNVLSKNCKLSFLISTYYFCELF